uniref:Protein kinase domain-containing protein n=1 Tax=Macrostomum lignano TaxID=282301 RepID=A0A1I8F6T9_9PLAT
EYTVYPVANPPRSAQESLCPRFPTQRQLQHVPQDSFSGLCLHCALKEAAIRLQPESPVTTAMLSKAMTSHASFEGSLPVVDFLSGLLARRRQGGGHGARGYAQSNDEIVCGAVPHWPAAWAHMTSLAEAETASSCSGGCRLIDLQIYVYNLLSPGALCCSALDNLPLDPSVLKVQFANYLILDLRFMIFLNATLLGLTFRRAEPLRAILWGRHADRRTPFATSLMTPIYKVPRRLAAAGTAPRKSGSAGDQRRARELSITRCCTWRIPTHSTPTIVGLTWCLAALASCLFDSQLAAAEEPLLLHWGLGQRQLSPGELARAGASLQSVRCRPISKSIGNFACCPASCLCCSCAARNPRLWRRLSKKMQQQQQQPAAADASASTGGTGHNVHREQLCAGKYTREETELVLSSLAEGGTNGSDSSMAAGGRAQLCIPWCMAASWRSAFRKQLQHPAQGGVLSRLPGRNPAETRTKVVGTDELVVAAVLGEDGQPLCRLDGLRANGVAARSHLLHPEQPSGTSRRRRPAASCLSMQTRLRHLTLELLGPAPPPSAIFNRIFSQPRSNVGWRIRTTDDDSLKFGLRLAADTSPLTEALRSNVADSAFLLRLLLSAASDAAAACQKRQRSQSGDIDTAGLAF